MSGMSDMFDKPVSIVPLRRERSTVLLSLPPYIRTAAGFPATGYVYLRVRRPGLIELSPVRVPDHVPAP